MKKESAIKIRRVHWRSDAAVPAAICGAIALMNVISIIRGGKFLLGHAVIMLFVLAAGGSFLFAVLQTVVFTAEEIQVKIAGITLRKIPLSEIRTIVYLPAVPYLLDDLRGNYLVLSTKSQEDIQSYGEAVIGGDPYLRDKLIKQGRKSEEQPIKIRAYFWRHFRQGRLKKDEGLWVSTSMTNMEKIRSICSHAAYLTTW